MTNEHWRFLLDGAAWTTLGVAIGRGWAWQLARRGRSQNTPLERFTAGIVVMITLSGVAFSVSTEIKADSTASCVNATLGKRNGPQALFAKGLDDVYAGRITPDQFKVIVHSYRDAVFDHPLGRC